MGTLLREIGASRSARRIAAAMLLAATAGAGVSTAARANGPYRQHVYSDSFGNLVVYSPSGYKRIVVGKGYLADDLRANNAPREPRVVYLHGDRRPAYSVRCERHAVLLHGRSYMYGLPDGVVPEPSACE